MKRSLLLLLSFLCSIVLSSGRSPAAPRDAGVLPPPSDAQILDGLSALHQGRFSEGQARFRAFLDGDPADPRGHLFLAFSEWWRLLQLRGAAESPAMEFHLQEAIRLAQARLEQNPEDPETLASLGTGYIFLAQYRAAQRRVLRAAMAAKKGKSFLEKALKSDSGLTDSRFALGAYNYYADKVNVLVKGLRTVMFLPGGNSELGLSQLEEVSEKGRYFRTEAHLLLAIILQGHHERRYLKALDHLRAALVLNPGSPVVLISIGELQIRLGRYPEAQATLRQAVDVALHARDPDQAELAQLSRVLLSDSLDLSLHSVLALRELVSSLNAKEIQPDLRARALAVATRAATRIGDPQSLGRIYDDLGVEAAERELLRKRFGATERQDDIVRKLDPALNLLEAGRWEDAIRLLEELQAGYPASTEVRLHLARAFFEQGKWPEAETVLRQISETAAGVVPGWIRGWRNLYLGRSLAEQGKKAEGKVFYRKAAETEGFRAKDLARALLGPEGDDPALWPPRVFGRAQVTQKVP